MNNKGYWMNNREKWMNVVSELKTVRYEFSAGRICRQTLHQKCIVAALVPEIFERIVGSHVILLFYCIECTQTG